MMAGEDVEEYNVLVRNELTGETKIVSIEALSAKDAQVEALTRCFRREGWRVVSASEPERMAAEARSA
jgi:hypothetical protein